MSGKPSLSPIELDRVRDAARSELDLIASPDSDGNTEWWECKARGKRLFSNGAKEPFDSLMAEAEVVYAAILDLPKCPLCGKHATFTSHSAENAPDWRTCDVCGGKV